MPESREWIAEGTKVFVLAYAGIRIAVIQKVTARDIVLDNGERFNRASLSHADGPNQSVRLEPLTDPAAIHRLRTQNAATAARNVADRAQKFSAHPSEDGAANIEAAVTAWRVAAERLERTTNE